MMDLEIYEGAVLVNVVKNALSGYCDFKLPPPEDDDINRIMWLNPGFVFAPHKQFGNKQYTISHEDNSAEKWYNTLKTLGITEVFYKADKLPYKETCTPRGVQKRNKLYIEIITVYKKERASIWHGESSFTGEYFVFTEQPMTKEEYKAFIGELENAEDVTDKLSELIKKYVGLFPDISEMYEHYSVSVAHKLITDSTYDSIEPKHPFDPELIEMPKPFRHLFYTAVYGCIGIVERRMIIQAYDAFKGMQFTEEQYMQLTDELYSTTTKAVMQAVNRYEKKPKKKFCLFGK